MSSASPERNQQESDRRFLRDLNELQIRLELHSLQETEGIINYHEKFVLICGEVAFPEPFLVSIFLNGLQPDTQMNVRMFQPHTVRQCLMIGKLYESAHPRQPRKSEKRSVPQDTEFRAPDVCSPINPQESMDFRSIGSTIVSDISFAEDEECQENSQNRFVHGITSNPSEFVFQGDLDKPEMGSTLVLLKLKGDQELLNTMMDDCKEKSIQFFPAHHAPQLFDEMPEWEFKDFRRFQDRFRPSIQRSRYSGMLRFLNIDCPRFNWDKVKEWLFKIELFYEIDHIPTVLGVGLVVVVELDTELSAIDVESIEYGWDSGKRHSVTSLDILYAHQLFDNMPRGTIIIFDTSVDEEFTLGGVWLLFAIYAPYDRAKKSANEGGRVQERSVEARGVISEKSDILSAKSEDIPGKSAACVVKNDSDGSSGAEAESHGNGPKGPVEKLPVEIANMGKVEFSNGGLESSAEKSNFDVKSASANGFSKQKGLERVGESDGFGRSQRNGSEVVGFHSLKSAGEGTSRYNGNGVNVNRIAVLMENQSEVGKSNGAEDVGTSREELLRKLDELKEQLSEACNVNMLKRVTGFNTKPCGQGFLKGGDMLQGICTRRATWVKLYGALRADIVRYK